MTIRRSIGVLIATPHEMMRRSLASFIVHIDEITIIGEAKNGAETIHLCEYHQPDVLLLGQFLPEMEELALVQVIRKQENRPYIIMLDGFLSGDYKQAILEAGVNVYFTVDTPIHMIVDAIYAGRR